MFSSSPMLHCFVNKLTKHERTRMLPKPTQHDNKSASYFAGIRKPKFLGSTSLSLIQDNLRPTASPPLKLHNCDLLEEMLERQSFVGRIYIGNNYLLATNIIILQSSIIFSICKSFYWRKRWKDIHFSDVYL